MCEGVAQCRRVFPSVGVCAPLWWGVPSVGGCAQAWVCPSAGECSLVWECVPRGGRVFPVCDGVPKSRRVCPSVGRCSLV